MSITAEPIWHERLFSGGWTRGSGEILEIRAPGSGDLVGRISSATAADLDDAVRSAAAAQRAWASAPHTQRSAVMLAAADRLEENAAALTPMLAAESGSSQFKAGIEIAVAVAELREAAALASHPDGELLRSAKPRLSFARRVPIGVVGVIAPFNMPLVLAMRSVAPALALGNAVVLKPDARTSIGGGLLIADVLSEAGLPEGVLHVLPGDGALGAALVTHPGVPCISFTGSTAAGRNIAAAAAPLLKRLHLELGGNNALLVLPDADVEAAASVAAWGTYFHQGQVCMTSGRHLVHRSLADQYVQALVRRAQAIPLGDSSDPANMIGPLIDERQRDRVHGLVTQAVEHGAAVATGGAFDGLYYQPTVLTDVAGDNPAWTEEIFGPVAPVYIYDDIDEAIDLINDSEYGLSVSILSADALAAYELSARLEVGAVHINDSTIDDEPNIPFGGIKASGMGGRFGGPHANLETFTELQWVTMQSQTERYPF